jgi:hypothetical protein
LLLAMPVFAQEPVPVGVIWQDRGDASALDLVGGPGGKDHEPGDTFTFIEESSGGTSPKFEVRDERGIKWKVKLGEEAKSETAATRLLWAAGYLVDEIYYRPSIRVLGLPRLARGREFVSEGGPVSAVSGARLEREREPGKSTTWSWYDNPFVGTREFNGLKVMMALINNWDLKEVNNRASETAGRVRYEITDLGASFGRTGNIVTRSKSISKDYAETRFIDKVTPTSVDFVLQSRPFFPLAVHVPNYRTRTRMESIVKGIPIADARWIGSHLGQLSAAQIRDCFRASGFSPADVEAYTQAVMQRIAALKAPDPQPPISTADARPGPDVIDPVATVHATRCLESTCRQVPVRETLTAINLKTPYARAIVGGFEQGAGIAGGGQLTSANAIRGLELRATVLTSYQFYRRFDAGAFFPSVGGSRNHADVWVSYQQRDTDFFGIGPQTSIDLESQFMSRRRSVQGSFYRDVTDHVQGGVYAQVMATETSLALDGAAVSIDERFSSTPVPPLDRWIPGLGLNTDVLAYGGFVVYDTRDDSLGLTRGVNFYGRVALADGVGRLDPLASYGWIEGEVDLRGYAPLGSPRTSLLLRARGLFKTPRGEGSQIPFYDLAWLGGRSSLRGYHSYRFRGNNVTHVSTELQRTVRAITSVRGVDLFGFVDAGLVWGDARSSTDLAILTNQDFRSRNWRSGLGGGLQYRHSPSLGARVEAGRSDENVLVYLSMSRGF